MHEAFYKSEQDAMVINVDIQDLAEIVLALALDPKWLFCTIEA